MTGYVTISNTAIDQDSPITVALVTALRDNPIAITEGASGAPKIQTAALQDGLITLAKLKTPASGNNILWSYWNNDTSAAAEDAWNGDLWCNVRIQKTGTYKIRIVVKKTAGGSSTYLKAIINKNGTNTGSECSATGSGAVTATLDQDFSLSAGDEISYQFYKHRYNPVDVANGNILIYICADVPYTFYCGSVIS